MTGAVRNLQITVEEFIRSIVGDGYSVSFKFQPMPPDVLKLKIAQRIAEIKSFCPPRFYVDEVFMRDGLNGYEQRIDQFLRESKFLFADIALTEDKGVTVLRTFENRSRPGVFYEVRRGRDEKVYCTCPGWYKRKSCVHTDTHFGENNG